jgi:uncharacterized protein YuzE
VSQAVNMVEPLGITSHSEAQKYEVVSTWRQAMYIVATQPVLVKAFDDVLIIRRGTGTPKEVVSGKADVIIGLDEWGHVVNVEIEFAEYYFQDAETAREILKKAKW